MAHCSSDDVNSSLSPRDARSPLHLASSLGNLAFVQLLIWVRNGKLIISSFMVKNLIIVFIPNQTFDSNHLTQFTVECKCQSYWPWRKNLHFSCKDIGSIWACWITFEQWMSWYHSKWNVASKKKFTFITQKKWNIRKGYLIRSIEDIYCIMKTKDNKIHLLYGTKWLQSFLNNHKNENLKLQRVHRQENMECWR